MDETLTHKRATCTQRDIDVIRDLVRGRVQNSEILKVGQAFGYQDRTTYKYISLICESETCQSPVMKRRGGPHNVVWNDEMNFAALCAIEIWPDITLDGIKENIEIYFDTILGQPCPTVSLSTIWRHLDGELITFKKVSHVPFDRNTDRTLDLRYEFAANWHMLIDHKTPIFVDESGASLFTRRQYGRSRRGDRVSVESISQPGKHCNIIGGISPEDGLIHSQIRWDSVNHDAFTSYIVELATIAELQYPEKSFVIIMDNARIHNAGDIEEALVAFPLMTFAFQPPWSPFLNIMENGWSSMKSRMKELLMQQRDRVIQTRLLPWGQRTAGRQDILQEVIEESLQTITQEKCLLWFSHMLGYLPRCMQREKILQ